MDNQPTSRIRRIEVTGLFGLYDHDIQLNREDRVTILHGPNGVGKTMVLRLLAGLFSWRIHEFGKVAFDQFKVWLNDGRQVVVQSASESNGKKGKSSASRRMRLSLIAENGTVLEGEGNEGEVPTPTISPSEVLDMIRHAGLPLSPTEDGEWFDHRSEERMSFESVLTRYSDFIPARLRKSRTKTPAWFEKIREAQPVHMIETQRLIRLTQARGRWPEERSSNSVSENASDLHRRIEVTQAEFGRRSQRLDQSIPQRLLDPKAPEFSRGEIKDKMALLESRRGRLKEIGLLDDSESPPFETAKLDDANATELKVMSLYVRDSEQKLAVLEDLAKRITLLLGNINAKFRHKSIRINRERGFIALGSNSTPLDLDALSSGEQHELVLLYDLLFRVKPNTLVLIDEPELSLHISWQKQFLPDLIEIAKTAEFDALVATHSPFIVGDRMDLLVELGSERA